MSRQTKPAYDLTDAEKRDLTQLIAEGRSLPEKYRFILFEDKREVELVWNGKTRDVCTTVLPFQTLEHIDEPRTETKTQGDLFDSRGRQQRGWTNKLIWGDNKLILSSLKSGALLPAPAVEQVSLRLGFGPRLVNVFQCLEGQHRGADIAGFAVPHQFDLALVLEQDEAVLFRQRLALLDQRDQVALLGFAQLIGFLVVARHRQAQSFSF